MKKIAFDFDVERFIFSLLNLLDMSGAHHGKCVIYKYLGFNIFVCSR